MKSVLLVLCACAAIASETQQTWVPSEHPATIIRRFTAYTQAARSMDLAAEDAARLQSLDLFEGQMVPSAEEWPVVARLDDELARLDESIAHAQADQAARDAERARAEIRLAEREVSWRAKELARLEGLAERDIATERDLDAARFELDAAKLRVEVALAAVAQAEQREASAAATLRQASHIRQRHVLRAPAGWTVIERLTEPGTLLTPGMPVLRLADLTTLEVMIRLAPEEILAVRALDGLPLRFVAEGTEATATVQRVDPRFDPQSRKREVVLEIPASAAPEASGGLEVQFTLAVPDPTGAQLIPVDWIVERFEQRWVNVQGGRQLPIIVLRQQGNHVLVSGDAFPEGTVLVPPTPVADELTAPAADSTAQAQ